MSKGLMWKHRKISNKCANSIDRICTEESDSFLLNNCVFSTLKYSYLCFSWLCGGEQSLLAQFKVIIQANYWIGIVLQIRCVGEEQINHIFMEHFILDLTGFVILENNSDHLLNIYCAPRTHLKLLDSCNYWRSPMRQQYHSHFAQKNLR